MATQPAAWRHWAVRVYRAGILVAIVFALRLNTGENAYEDTITLEQVQQHFPTGVKLEPKTGVTWVYGQHGERQGYVAKTLPIAKDVIGYSGPSDVLIAFDKEGVVTGTSLLYSGDTEEHVEAVLDTPSFFDSFTGWKLSDENDADHIDGVSGATLTSYAIIEAMAIRLGGHRPSLKFSDPVDVKDVQRIFPEADRLDDKRVLNAEGVVIGTVLRSAPHTDDIIGYQGPSDALIGLDLDEKVAGITIGHSYEGQRYADSVRDSTYYQNRHQGKTLEDLANIDLDRLHVDAVSGATMTSMAVGEAAAIRAQLELDKRSASAGKIASIPVRTRDIATVVAIMVACFVAFTRSKYKRRIRFALQLYLIAVLGLWVGDMLSLALMGGWATGSVPWKIAPGLVALVAAAFILPWTSGKPVYCHHLCPHGAAQELLFRIVPGRISLPNGLRHMLRYVPIALLVAAVGIIGSGAPVSLSALEPFDAWVFGVAGIATISIAIIGLAASAFIPQAYCKYGCPTGLVLNYPRTRRHEHGLNRNDLLAAGLVVIAFIAGAI